MKKFNTLLFLRIALLTISAIAFGFFLSQQHFWASGIAALFLFWSVSRLHSFQKRNAKDLKRLIDAIRFSEFNITFGNFSARGLSPKLISGMETSISHFNSKLQKMEAEQSFYNTLLDRIDFGVIAVDKQERIKWINKSALELFEKPQPKILEDLSKISPTLPQALRDLLPKETKIIKFGEGETMQKLAVTAVYFVSEGKQLNLISLKNIQSVLEESESEAWKKLIRVLTHEIMNSITPIISLAETFASPNKEIQKMLPQAMQTIHRRSKGLVDFVHNYQKLSRIPDPIITIFSASELMNDIAKLLEADGLKFTYAIQPPDISLKADRAQMEQVMINLIKNACEATDNQSNPQVKVEIGYNENHRPIIKVTDNGDGILPEVLDKVFIPFFTTKTNGSGIGLSICRQIVQLHGGSISVQSEVGKGSCFWVVL
jgi:nitrogen fixation/metabolism regulation signal transduction histidine kinase